MRQESVKVFIFIAIKFQIYQIFLKKWLLSSKLTQS